MTVRAALPSPLSPPWLLRRAALAQVALAAAALAWLGLIGLPPLSAFYLTTQDAPLLAIGTAGLLALSLLPAREGPGGDPRLIGAIVLAAALIAYAGTWAVVDRYPLSRDEALGEFAARHLARGQLVRPIPPALMPVAPAMMPLWADRLVASGQWVSGYLPGSAMIRAAFGLLGDRWLAGPALLAIGLGALAVSARRLWPGNRAPMLVAVLLAATSTQLLALAMTPYAMIAHFAFNAVWLALVLTGGRGAIAAAALVTVAAMGLHQFHHHLLFVAGPIAWLWLSGRRSAATMLAAACVAGWLVWDVGYNRWLIGSYATAPGRVLTPYGVADRLGIWAGRLGELDPLAALARFAAWQNVLLLPLAALGLAASRDAEGRATPALALRLTCVIACLPLVFQGHGLGYRYLTGTIPAVALLAAYGWQRCAAAGRALPTGLLWGSALVALAGTMPFAFWRTHQMYAGYAAAAQAARSADADVVLVDPGAAAYIQDIVRVEGAIRPPLVLDLAQVPPGTLAWLCGARRVALLDARKARRFGLPDIAFTPPNAERLALARSIASGCAAPLR